MRRTILEIQLSWSTFVFRRRQIDKISFTGWIFKKKKISKNNELSLVLKFDSLLGTLSPLSFWILE